MINNSLIRWAYWSFDFYLTLIFNQIIQLSTSFGKNIEQDWSYKFKWQGHFIWQLFDLHLHIFFAIIDYDLLFFNYLLNLHYQFTVFVSFTTFLSLAYLHCQFTIFVSFATFLSLAYLISCCPKSPASKFLFVFWHVLRMSTLFSCSRLRHLCDGSHKSPEHARSQMVYCSDCQCTHTCTNCLAAFLGAFNIPLSFAILWPCPWHGPFDLRLPDGGQSNVASMDSKKIVFKALINI